MLSGSNHAEVWFSRSTLSRLQDQSRDLVNAFVVTDGREKRGGEREGQMSRDRT